MQQEKRLLNSDPVPSRFANSSILAFCLLSFYSLMLLLMFTEKSSLLVPMSPD